LQHPDLPLLARFGKRAAVPIELLDIIPGQFYRGVAPDPVKQKMLQMSGDVKPNARFEEVKSAYDVSPYYNTTQLLTHPCSRWASQPQITYGRVASPSSLVSSRPMLVCSHTLLWSMRMSAIKWWVDTFPTTKDAYPVAGKQWLSR
jgi:hypothetical protein